MCFHIKKYNLERKTTLPLDAVWGGSTTFLGVTSIKVSLVGIVVTKVVVGANFSWKSGKSAKKKKL